jgi:prepilin-type N-terminal cleavage/methylation domain-containing protein
VNCQEFINQPALKVHAADNRKKIVMQINTSRKSGFTLVEIMIVVAIIGLLAAIAIPNFVKARTASQRSACVANLKQIDGAKSTFALEAKKKAGDTVASTDIFGSTSYIRVAPTCPSTGTDYTINVVDTKPACPNQATLTDHVLP